MSKPQLDKVHQLVAEGWKIVTAPPFPPGGLVELESPAGEKCTVSGDGSVTEH